MSEGLTKKQIKELRRLEKLQSRNLEQKNSSFKWAAIAIVSALFLILFVGIIFVAKNKNNPTNKEGKVSIANDAYARMLDTNGNESTQSAENINAAVTLVEYGDLQCPACKLYYPDVKQLLVDYKGQLKLVFKNFPLINVHPNAMGAAIAAEAVGKQGKYFQFVDILYDKQAEWAELKLVDSKFEEYAKSIGVNIDQYRKDLKDPAIKTLIDKQRNEGIANGVTGTPTFFVNGERISTPANLQEFKKVIDAALLKPEVKEKETTAPTQGESVPKNLPLQQ